MTKQRAYGKPHGGKVGHSGIAVWAALSGNLCGELLYSAHIGGGELEVAEHLHIEPIVLCPRSICRAHC